MPNYSWNTQGIDDTSGGWELCPSDSVDREVLISLASGTTNTVRISNASIQVASGVILNEMVSAESPVLRYLLPSGEDLWAVTDSGNAVVNLIVTKV